MKKLTALAVAISLAVACGSGATSSIFVGTRACRPSGAAQPSLPATIGFVKVTAFSGSGDVAAAFADHIHHTIIAADRDDLVGWVVDLRGNGGGNMWPRDQPRVAVLSDHSIASSGEATLDLLERALHAG